MVEPISVSLHMVLQPPSSISVFLTSSLLIFRSTLCLVVAGGSKRKEQSKGKEKVKEREENYFP